MPIGILAGLATCALWALTFVAPRVVVPFSAWDLAVARYGVFGVTSTLLMLHPRFRPSGFSRGRLATGLLLGGAGYTGYFISAAYAVRLAGAAIPPVVIGIMPVILAIVGNAREGSVPWRWLAGPLALIGTGVAVVNVAVLGRAAPGHVDGVLLGIAASLVALAVWIVYGLINALIMRAEDPPDALRWTGLQGIGAALGSLVVLPLTSLGALRDIGQPASVRFILWALLMGLAGSWFATWCWVVASRRLPVALSAQLIVAETVFGLLYGFLFEARWPSPAEWCGAGLQLIGVGVAIAVFARPSRGRLAIAPHVEPLTEGTVK